jgi:hypothetical protein
MRHYLVVTAALFGLLVLAHIARIVFEGPQVLADTFFVTSTLIAAGLCVWACRLLRQSGPSA